MRLAVFLILLATTTAGASEWQVGPAATWAGDSEVNVVHWFTEGTPTGAPIGIDSLMVGPLLPGVTRPVAASQFEGTGRVVCLNAYAIRGTVRSQGVSSCAPAFRLDDAVLSFTK